jgi:hypothetical protein
LSAFVRKSNQFGSSADSKHVIYQATFGEMRAPLIKSKSNQALQSLTKHSKTNQVNPIYEQVSQIASEKPLKSECKWSNEIEKAAFRFVSRFDLLHLAGKIEI